MKVTILSGYMYFSDISLVNSVVREAYTHVYHLVFYIISGSEIWKMSWPCMHAVAIWLTACNHMHQIMCILLKQ